MITALFVIISISVLIGLGFMYAVLNDRVMPCMECFLYPGIRRSRSGRERFDIFLKIGNYGSGVARNVTITLDIDEQDMKDHDSDMRFRRTAVPIAVIPPGSEMTICCVGSASEMIPKVDTSLPLRPFTASVGYEYWTLFAGTGRRSDDHTLDVSQFRDFEACRESARMHDSIKNVLDRSSQFPGDMDGNVR